MVLVFFVTDTDSDLRLEDKVNMLESKFNVQLKQTMQERQAFKIKLDMLEKENKALKEDARHSQSVLASLKQTLKSSHI